MTFYVRYLLTAIRHCSNHACIQCRSISNFYRPQFTFTHHQILNKRDRLLAW